MTEVRYRFLVAGDYPGTERRMAEDLEFLRSLGIPVVSVSPGNTTRH